MPQGAAQSRKFGVNATLRRVGDHYCDEKDTRLTSVLLTSRQRIFLISAVSNLYHVHPVVSHDVPTVHPTLEDCHHAIKYTQSLVASS